MLLATVVKSHDQLPIRLSDSEKCPLSPLSKCSHQVAWDQLWQPYAQIRIHTLIEVATIHENRLSHMTYMTKPTKDQMVDALTCSTRSESLAQAHRGYCPECSFTASGHHAKAAPKRKPHG